MGADYYCVFCNAYSNGGDTMSECLGCNAEICEHPCMIQMIRKYGEGEDSGRCLKCDECDSTEILKRHNERVESSIKFLREHGYTVEKDMPSLSSATSSNPSSSSPSSEVVFDILKFNADDPQFFPTTVVGFQEAQRLDLTTHCGVGKRVSLHEPFFVGKSQSGIRPNEMRNLINSRRGTSTSTSLNNDQRD